MKPLSKSMFHPRRAVGQRFLLENRKLIAQIDRRNAVRGSLSLGAPYAARRLRGLRRRAVADRAARRFRLNDRVQPFIFRPDHLAPTYSEAQVVKPPRFNAPYDVEDVKTGRRCNLEARTFRSHRRQTAVDRGTALRSARTGIDHQAHLRGGLGLHRPVVGREPACVLRAHRRRYHRKVCGISLRRRLH